MTVGDSSPPSPWKPLSVRQGTSEAEGPFEGVPAHLMPSVTEWIYDTLHTRSYEPDTTARRIVLQLQVTGTSGYSRVSWLQGAARRDQDKALDIIDAVLYWTEGETADEIDEALLLGGSAWCVNDTQDGLTRRVSTAEQDSYSNAANASDAASEQLRTAWSKVYGRLPDYSDAWDHAIKACEALLAPVVVPKSNSSTLGSIISAIEAKPSKFELALPSSHRDLSSVETFVGMLRLIWPNPDRHETGPSRPPTAEEARDVVHLAVTIVNWVRQGSFTVAP